tara:strand:- start:695 stop:1066 length:372 start_codon:yes stop_codon:yes gene_type:complete
MASELRVNTLKDASGNNSVATSVVAEGTAKSWHYFDQSANTLRDSTNVSTISDDSATGRYTVNYTNDFNTAYYAVALGTNALTNQIATSSSLTASSAALRTRDATQADTEAGISTGMMMGDLA